VHQTESTNRHNTLHSNFWVLLPEVIGGLPGVRLRILGCLLLLEKRRYYRLLLLANSVCKKLC